MIQNNEKFSVVINNEEYNNSTKYSYEKKFDFARYFIEHHRIVDEFKKGYADLEKVAEQFNCSTLDCIKSRILHQAYSDVEKDRITKNSMEIEVVVTKNKKESRIKELKISDELVDYFTNKMILNRYNKYLEQYKTYRDEGKKQFLILEYGKEYSTKEEFRNIKMLLKTTRNALELLDLKSVDEKEESKITEWKDFLSTNVTIKSYSIEYDIVITEIEYLPEFNKQELDTIHNLNEYFENALSECKSNTAVEEPEIEKN